MGRSEERTQWEPVAASERHTTLDLLRGVALFGVLLVNLLYFFRLSLFEHLLSFHSHAGRVNHAVDLLTAELVEFKAFHLFSLTFGIGVAVQAERTARRGVRTGAFLVRRFLFLFAIGACHMLLVSNVDILALYAVCGLLLIPLLRLPTALLAIAGLAAIYLPSALPLEWPLPPEPALREHAENATRVYGQGGFGAILAFRLRETRELILPLLIGVAQQTFGLMLLGVAVWRTGVLREPRKHRHALWAVCLVAGVAGLLNTTSDVLARSSGRPAGGISVLGALGSHVPLALAYAAGLLAWRRSERADALLAPVAAAGRMALTNYLVQSLALGLLFYGYGFGLFGRLDPSTAAALGVALYAVQLGFSRWWLNRYRFGPFEWLWRSMTYGRRQPMRLSASAQAVPMPGRTGKA